MQIQISWLLQKPTDLDLHCLQMQGISGFSRTRVKTCACLIQIYLHIFSFYDTWKLAFKYRWLLSKGTFKTDLTTLYIIWWSGKRLNQCSQGYLSYELQSNHSSLTVTLHKCHLPITANFYNFPNFGLSTTYIFLQQPLLHLSKGGRYWEVVT